MERILAAKPGQPFEDTALAFLGEVSALLFRDPETRAFPDIVALAFFMRKTNLHNLKEAYLARWGENLRIGRGVAFHITPANVPANFMYSLCASMLAGNGNIVKLSSKEPPQQKIILRALQKALELRDHADIQKGLMIVKYPGGSEMTDYFSSVCDVRIVWGGDETIAAVRRSALPPRSTEILFADRVSFCALDAKAVLNCKDIAALAHQFYNDTYLMNQNACSSPRLVVWRGREPEVSPAKEKFWGAVREIVRQKYVLQPILTIDKYTQFCRDAIEHGHFRLITPGGNHIYRLEMESLPRDAENIRCAGGYFAESAVESLAEIAHIVNKKYQTLTYFGIEKEELVRFFLENGLKGIDRIVPVGAALDFGLIWDGYDLITHLSRECAVNE